MKISAGSRWEEKEATESPMKKMKQATTERLDMVDLKAMISNRFNK